MADYSLVADSSVGASGVTDTDDCPSSALDNANISVDSCALTYCL